MSYVVPYLPASSRTVRLIPSAIPRDSETELSRRAAEILAHHAGPMRSLSIEPLQDADFADLKRFGLVLVQQACRQFPSATDQFTTCPLTPQVSPSAKDQAP